MLVVGWTDAIIYSTESMTQLPLALVSLATFPVSLRQIVAPLAGSACSKKKVNWRSLLAEQRVGMGMLSRV